MSIWTHIAGCIRVDDMKMIFQPNNKTDFSKIFVRNTWYHSNDNGNLPTGSEGSIDVEFIDRADDEATDYIRAIALFGDLRDFDEEDCQSVIDWWYSIPQSLGNDCIIRQAVLQVSPENGKMIVLTEKDMNIKENEDEE